MTTDVLTAPRPTVTAAPLCVGDRVELLVGGFRRDYGTITDIRGHRHYLTLDSGMPIGGFMASQLRRVGWAHGNRP